MKILFYKSILLPKVVKKLSVKAKKIVKSKKQIFFQRIGQKLIFNGWIILNLGAYLGNYGGDIRFQRGMDQVKKFLWPQMKAKLKKIQKNIIKKKYS